MNHRTSVVQATAGFRLSCILDTLGPPHLTTGVMPDDWPFDQAPHVAAITTRQVIEEGLPILRVTHYLDDDSWAFVCGTTDNTEDGRVIGMGEALELDPTLRVIADLPSGWAAWRKAVGAAWHKHENEKA